MSKPIHPAIREATRLTSLGKLGEATEVIRAMLSGRARSSARPTSRGSSAIRLPAPDAPVADAAWRDAPRSDGPAKGSFTAETYRSASGQMAYKLYVPAGVGAGAPLVVMLHGCTQNPDDFAAGTGMNRLADDLGLVVAYPAQSQSANVHKCWNWFVPGDQQRGSGEPALIAGLTAEIVATHRCDHKRVYVAGLSAGGAAAAIMGHAYPDVYAGVGVHSGLACGVASDLPSALSAMQRGGAGTARRSGEFVPTIIFHGDRDSTVAKVNARELLDQATAGAPPGLTEQVTKGRSANGQRYTRTTKADSAGRVLIEKWMVHGAGHAWSGGSPAGSYTDSAGPDASREMCRFFLDHRLG